MPTRWLFFGSVTVVLLAMLLFLATRSDADGLGQQPPPDEGPVPPERRSELEAPGRRPTPGETDPRFSLVVLVANTVLVHGLFGGLFALAMWYAEIPTTTLGLPTSGLVGLGADVQLGLGFGVMLFVANETAMAGSERLGLAPNEDVREMMAPRSITGWLVLLVVVLPFVAGFEEFLFRGILVGALSVGFGVSPWVLAAVSSVAFGIGHGAQGSGGVLITGVMGLVLAVAFVLTASLVVVIVAHYLVNALEFVVHEGIDWRPGTAEPGTGQ